MKLFITEDLFKAMHKYIKRTGTPGNYQYWYKMPDGSISAAPDKQEHGKKEHLQRLLAGRMREIHTKTNKQIAEEVGVPQKKVSDKDWGMKRPGQTLHTEHSDHHLHEANTDVNHGSYQGHVEAGQAEASGGSGSAASGRAASSRSTPARGTAASRAASERSTPAPASEDRVATRAAEAQQNWRQVVRTGSQETTPAAAEATTRTPEQIKAEKRQKLKELFGVDLGASAPAPTPAPAQSNDDVIREVFGDSRPAAAKAERAAAKERVIRENVARANEELAQARSSVARANAAAIEASSPDSPHAERLRATISDPVLDRDEAEISSMIAEQRAGENPYMNRAKKIMERIQHNVKDERRVKVGHMMTALANMKNNGDDMTKENLLNEYKRVSGSSRIQGLNNESRSGVGDEFEKATFHTIEECLTNPPINAEVERMKRGYAAKQFARCFPYLKPEWVSANGGAPPPHPTFGDFKTWTEHGGVKPAWAGTTKIAVPKEVFDAAHKSPDGKPKYPGPKVPIHMMPVWNYTAKKMERELGQEGTWGREGAAYKQTKDAVKDQTSPTGWKLDMGDQAKHLEGTLVASMRKYIQMRGGKDQLVDIPESKLAKEGLTHADIFKSESEDPFDIMQTKIIDMVALVPFIDEEIKSKKKVKKSFILTIDEKNTFNPKEDLRKAELIAKIKDLKKSKYVVGKNNLHGA